MDAQLCWLCTLFLIPITHARAILIFFCLYLHLAVTIDKVLWMVEFVGAKVIPSPTYYRHVDMYIQPTIHMFWERHQKELINTFIQTNISGLIMVNVIVLDIVQNMDPTLSWNKGITKSYMLTWCRVILMFLYAYLPFFVATSWSCFNLLGFV